MIKLTLLSLFVTFSFSQVGHANIFKWTDSEGKVHYSATPPKDTKEKAENIKDKIKMHVGKAQPKTTYQAPSRPPSADELAEMGDKGNTKDNFQQAQSQAKVAYCNGLRSNIQTLETSKNVNIAEEGKLKPLDSEQKKARLAKEKSNFEKNCSKA
jgi:hypothetical protein